MLDIFARPIVAIGDRLPDPMGGDGLCTVIALEDWEDKWPWVRIRFQRDGEQGTHCTGWPAFQWAVLNKKDGCEHNWGDERLDSGGDGGTVKECKKCGKVVFD